MKYVVLICASLVGVSFIFPAVQTVDLDQGLQSGVITLNANGNDGSTHYLKPLQITMQNRTNKKVVIRINSGYRFISLDSATQDIISTQEELLTLNPNERQNVSLSGMCIQHHNAAPGAGDVFHFGGYAQRPLYRMARSIDSANWQNIQAQQAMWLLSDGGELTDIYTYGDDEEWKILETVALISGKPLPDKKEFMTEQAERHQIKAELRGGFKFKFSKKVPIHIALFNSQGIVLQEIYRETASPGSHEVTYTFDALPYQGQTIYARFIAFDDVLMERTIAL